MVELKKQKHLELTYPSEIISLNAGHTPGSNMFLINDLLYTGDFNTEENFFGKATAVKCKTLIIETTFGKPKYIFPKRKIVTEEIRDYILEKEKVQLMTSSVAFGKPQEICLMLDKMKIPFNVSEEISLINNKLGLNFNYLDKKAKVIIAPKSYESNEIKDHKKVLLSGWALDSMHGRFHKSFVFSDHCDYPSLIEFVEACDPEIIYTHHGFANEFATDMRKIGFNAQPLTNLTGKCNQKKQKTLLSFNISDNFKSKKI